jgi:hypothetical protein
MRAFLSADITAALREEASSSAAASDAVDQVRHAGVADA